MSSLLEIHDIHDPRLAPYHNLRNRNPTRLAGHFIVESKLLVQRLIDSDYDIQSILVDDQQHIDSSWISRGVPIFLVPDVSQLIGFHFHRGALACGIRKPIPNAKNALSQHLEQSVAPWRSVYLHEVQDPENMGSIFRSCAALGIANVIVGRSCVDPYARRVVRVSMGTSLKLQLFEDSNAHDFITFLRERSISTIASSLSARSVSLRNWQPPAAWTLFLGNEAQGLPAELCTRCTDELTIPMADGVDSLNVSNAAAILIYILSGSTER